MDARESTLLLVVVAEREYKLYEGENGRLLLSGEKTHASVTTILAAMDRQ